jgi:hypothetical protein
MNRKNLFFRVRAIQQMFQRQILDAEIRYTLSTGKVTESFPAEPAYMIQRISGSRQLRNIQVVMAENRDTQDKIILTAYESKPDSAS